MSNLAARLSLLSADKLALLRSRLRAAGDGKARTQIPRLSRDRDSFPLSFAQERLWFLHKLQPESTAYNIPEVYGFPGPLNVAALEQSLQEIIRRHEILRARFVVQDGVPLQIIAAPEPMALPVINLRQLAAEARQDALRRLVAQAAEVTFDLARGPLVQVTLVALGDAEHVLLVTMHHIVSDGWSMAVFARELARIYDAYSAGRPSPLPDLALQYVDFAQWQRQSLTGAVLETQLDYWKRQLAGAPAVLDLPTDRPRPPMQTFVPADVTNALNTLARQEGATQFMVLLAVFKVLLYRWSGQPDLVVGTLIAGRNRVEIEGLIGFFVNTLALRTDLSGNPGFHDLLRRVRLITLEGFAHQDLPFEKLVGELRPERRLSHHPLFQVLFALQNIGAPLAPAPDPSAAVSAAGSQSADTPPIGGRTAKFDVALFMSPSGSGLAGAFEYNIDLFDAATMHRMAAHFVALLGGIAAAPDHHILDLPLDAVQAVDRGGHLCHRLVDTFDFERPPSA